MVVRQETRAGSVDAPAVFRDAVTIMRAVRLRPEVAVEPMAAPQRIAPFATALSADVTRDHDEVATGRIIVLHDPAGNDAWEGTFRCVAYCRAEIESELVTDPLLADVGWTWLQDALEAHGADYRAASGTVTRVTTSSYGTMSDDDGSAQIEIRASWSPHDEPLDIAPHVQAWGELLCTAAGMEPVPDGVAVMPNRRGQRNAAR